MRPLCLLILIAVLCSRPLPAAPAAAAPSLLWSQGDPSADEQNALEWLNRSRADPVGTLSALIAAAPADPVLAACFAALAPETPAQLLSILQSAYSVAAANSAAFPRSSAISQAPLAFYPAFLQRATALNPYAASSSGSAPLTSPTTIPAAPTFPPGRTPHNYYPPVPFTGILYSGPDQIFSGPNATGGSSGFSGSDTTATFGPYGANYSQATFANLYDPALGPREWLLAWLSAPGTGSPPPAFLSQGDALPDLTLAHTRLTGISIASAVAPGPRSLVFFRAGSEFFTASDLPYGAANTVFITGVAFRDQNNNTLYDPGEGLAGVSLTLDRSPWGAVTASAGGYAIPVPANSGTYVVTARGGPWAASPTTAQVMVGADSVKLDWVAPALSSPLPAQTTLAGSTGSTHLVNLSTRGRIEAGASALIGGFIVTGPAGAAETLLIRGVGPSLSTVGIPFSECVPATALALYSASPVPLATNTGWTTAVDGGLNASLTAAKIGAFPLTNWAGGGGDSALVTTLAPGAYSVVVTPAPGLPTTYTTGHIGLVEIYEVTAAGGAQLANLSSRGLMGTDDQQLIIGASLSGPGQQRLLLRAAGPALASLFNFSPALADPSLLLSDQTGATLATNDDWSNSAQTDQIRALALAVGAFPFPEGSVDSALVALLSAGQYTARVTAKPGTTATGLALVEIYSAP